MKKSTFLIHYAFKRSSFFFDRYGEGTLELDIETTNGKTQELLSSEEIKEIEKAIMKMIKGKQVNVLNYSRLAA